MNRPQMIPSSVDAVLIFLGGNRASRDPGRRNGGVMRNPNYTYADTMKPTLRHRYPRRLHGNVGAGGKERAARVPVRCVAVSSHGCVRAVGAPGWWYVPPVERVV